MTQPDHQRDPYLTEHVREALSQDPRTVGLEFEVVHVGSNICVRGTVSTPERRAAAQAVLDERFADHAVVNELTVRQYPEPTGAEHMA